MVWIRYGVVCLILSVVSPTIAGDEFSECGEPEPSANTYRTLYDSHVEYRCLDNYILTSGNLTRDCVNGTFTGTPPVCEFSCGPPLETGYANITQNGIGGGATVTYTCGQNSLNNFTTSVCDENLGYWNKGDLCFDAVPLNMATFQAVQTTTAVQNAFPNVTDDVFSFTQDAPFGAANAIDADTGTSLLSGSCSSTAAEHRPHINITMDKEYTIYMIVVVRPVDDFATSLPNIHISSTTNRHRWYKCLNYNNAILPGENFTAMCTAPRYPAWGKYIQIATDFGTETGMLQICNLEIYARPLSSVDCGQPFMRTYTEAVALNPPLDTHRGYGNKVYYSCTDGYTLKAGRRHAYCNVNGYWTSTLICTMGENWSLSKDVWQSTNATDMLPFLTDYNTSTCITVLDVKEATFVIDLAEDIEISDVSVTFYDVQKLNSPTINITVWREDQAPVSCEPYRLLYNRGQTGNAVCKYHPVGRYVSVHVFYDGKNPLEICDLMVHGRQYKDGITAYDGCSEKTNWKRVLWDPFPMQSSQCDFPLECYHQNDKADYKGRMNMTVAGLPCQRWDSQSPHAHNYTDPLQFPDATLNDAANFCRNPDGKYGLWCYTTDPEIPWQYCPVRHCDYMCLRDPKGSTYKGYVRETSSGEACVKWTSDSIPFKKKSHFANYPNNNLNCRNPLLSQSRPWCYTSIDASSYGQCSIPTCPTSSELIWGHWVMDVHQKLDDLLPSQECLVWNQLFLSDGNFSATWNTAFGPRRYLNTFTAAQICKAGKAFNTTVLCYKMTDNGTVWKTGILECVHCGAPPSVGNATVTTTSMYLNGVAKYTCKSGYGHASGSDVIKCLKTGEWEIPDMVCKVDCGAPPSVDNANATFNTTLEGEDTLFECIDGYMDMSGSHLSRCLGNGSWSVPDYICEVHCGPHPSINNTEASNTSGFLNSTVVYTCVTGYTRMSGSNTIMCLDTGQWQQPEIVCEVDCGTPPFVNNADVTAANTTLNGTAIYTCSAGYVYVNGSDTVTCTEIGLWEMPTIQCLVDCGAPPSLNNTEVRAVNTTLHSTAIYTCSAGFVHVNGSDNITCTEAGLWEVPSIQCSDSCGSPDQVPNATFTAETWIGGVAHYTCDDGFAYVSGLVDITCLENRTWEMPSIICEEITTSSPASTLQTTTSQNVQNVTDKYGRFRYESCICRCISPTRKQEDIVSEISKKLILNTKGLLSHTMKKESLPDERKTSHGIAYLAVSVIAIVFGVIFVSDFFYCYSAIRQYFQGQELHIH